MHSSNRAEQHRRQHSQDICIAPSLPSNHTTTTFENDSFPDNFVGINGNFFFTAQSSAFYSIESVTSDIVIGGRELWFSDGTEGGTRPISVNQNSYSYYEPEDGEYTTSQLSQPEFGFKISGAAHFQENSHQPKILYFVANDGNRLRTLVYQRQGSKLS